jgi:hypothetical protein
VVSIEIAADGASSLRWELSGHPRSAPVYLDVKLETLGFPSCARLPGTHRPGVLAALPPALDRLQSGGLIDTIAGDCPLHMEAQLWPSPTHREGLSEYPWFGAQETFCGEPVILAKGRLSTVPRVLGRTVQSRAAPGLPPMVGAVRPRRRWLRTIDQRPTAQPTCNVVPTYRIANAR